MRAGEGLADGTEVLPILKLTLPFELRQKSRLRARLDNGEEVALILPRGRVLRGGDRVTAADGRELEIVAAPENCSISSARSRPRAYHLGNRHVPLEVGPGFPRIADDHHVLEEVRVGAGISARAFEESRLRPPANMEIRRQARSTPPR